MVAASPISVSVWLFSNKAWCAQVTLTPEARRIAVLSKGVLKGLKTATPLGGQDIPRSLVGDNLLWKKAQKKLKKNNTSEVIKRIMPHRKPVTTFRVCRPCSPPSRLTSRHHW